MVQSRAGAGQTVQLALRLSEDLRDRVKKAAEDSGRSINSEIVATLEEKYPSPGLSTATIVSWGEHIASAPDAAERSKRLLEANSKLLAEPEWRQFRFWLQSGEGHDGKRKSVVTLTGPFGSQRDFNVPKNSG